MEYDGGGYTRFDKRECGDGQWMQKYPGDVIIIAAGGKRMFIAETEIRKVSCCWRGRYVANEIYEY